MADAPLSVLITGGTSELGRALAHRFLERPSARVLLTSRSAGQLEELTGDPRVCYLPSLDLTVEADLERLALTVDSYFSARFSVVNAVGQSFSQKSLQDLSLSEASALIDSNYLAVYGVAHYIVPLITQRGGGHFVAFSCSSVDYHYPLMAAYTASKAAVESLITSLANEFAKEGLIANSIVLSTLLTERERRMKPFGDHSNWLQPGDVASEVERLIDDHVGLVNGNAINLFRYSDSFFHESYFSRIRHE